MASPRLPLLAQALPLDGVVRIELCEGVPVFRAPAEIHCRIEELLEHSAQGTLSAEEARELGRYEELDELLSLVNRLIRNETLAGGTLAQSA